MESLLMSMSILILLNHYRVFSYLIQGQIHEGPLIYDGLHEVCAFCRSKSHQIESSSDLPIQSKVKIVMKTLEGPMACRQSILANPSSSNEPVTIADKWTRVFPKKRFKSTYT